MPGSWASGCLKCSARAAPAMRYAPGPAPHGGARSPASGRSRRCRQARAMRQQLLDRHVFETAIRRYAVAAEEARQRVAQRRREREPAVADQRRDAGAGDRLRHAADQRRRAGVGVVAFQKDRLAVTAHGSDGCRRAALRNPGVKRLAVKIGRRLGMERRGHQRDRGCDRQRRCQSMAEPRHRRIASLLRFRQCRNDIAHDERVTG